MLNEHTHILCPHLFFCPSGCDLVTICGPLALAVGGGTEKETISLI